MQNGEANGPLTPRVIASLEDLPARGGVPPTESLVAVVIVGYNSKEHLAKCLESLTHVDYHALKLIYVDNASVDSSLEFVEREFPRVLTVRSIGNIGYCGGNNVGIRLALEAKAEFILILNPDTTVVNPSFVRELVEYLRDHPRVGKVGPRVFLREKGVTQNTVMTWPSIARSVSARFISGTHLDDTNGPQEVDVLNGCCILIRTAALRDIGLYDEEYFAYGDESEWDWRAEQAGWKRHHVPIDSIIHHQKQDGYDFASFPNFLMKRNTALWFLNAGKPLDLLAWIVATTAMACGRTVIAPLRGQSVSSYAAFLGRLTRAYTGILARLVAGQRRSPEALKAGI